MSRASGRLTGRSSRTSSRNQSRQGTIHAENPELLKLLKENTPPEHVKSSNNNNNNNNNNRTLGREAVSSKANTPRSSRSSITGGDGNTLHQNSDVTSSATSRKVADKVKFAPELGPAEDDSGTDFPKEESGSVKNIDDYKGGGTKEKDADSGHYEGNEYVIAEDSENKQPENAGDSNTDNGNLYKAVNNNIPEIPPEFQNNDEADNQISALEKREGAFTEANQAPKDSLRSPDNISNGAETYRKQADGDEVNTDSFKGPKTPDNPDKPEVVDKSDNNPNIEDSLNQNPSVTNTDRTNDLNANQTLTRSNSELDGQTLKSIDSSTSELARLHSPSRKSLNIDFNDQDPPQNESNAPEDNPVTGLIETKPDSPKLEPTYSVVSPRQSKSSFNEGDNSNNNSNNNNYSTRNSQSLSDELKLKLKLEDSSQNRTAAPYSSQRLKSQGDLAKRTASVRSENVPDETNKGPVIEDNRDQTPIDSLEIEKDSLDVDDEDTQPKIEATESENKDLAQVQSNFESKDITGNTENTEIKVPDTGEREELKDTKSDVENTDGIGAEIETGDRNNTPEGTGKESIEENKDFSEDSLSNSLDTKTSVTPTQSVLKDRNSPGFLRERSDSEDTIVGERTAVESVGQIEKHLSGPNPATNRDYQRTTRYQSPRLVEQPVEFVIKSEPGSRYSSSIPGSRRDSHSNSQRPTQSHTTPKSSTRRHSGATPSRKKVYIESPTFTQEEEGEYRFVKSRLDDLDDSTKHHTFRELDTFEVERKERATPKPYPRNMPEKRVRYSDLDNEYREKELAIYSYDGKAQAPDRVGAAGHQDGGGGVISVGGGGGGEVLGYGNAFSSNDESDKENRRRDLNGIMRNDQQQQQQHRLINIGGGADTTQYSNQPVNQRRDVQMNRNMDHSHGSHVESQPHHGYAPVNMSRPPPYSHNHPHHHSHHHNDNGNRPSNVQLKGVNQNNNPMFTPPAAPPLRPPVQVYKRIQQPQEQQQEQPQEKPKVRGLSLPTGPTYDPDDENDLEMERSYQQGLKSRIDSGNRQAEQTVIPPLHLQQDQQQSRVPQQQPHYGNGSNNYDPNMANFQRNDGGPQSFAQDSLDYETEDTARYSYNNNTGNFPRDSIDVYGDRQQQIPYQQGQGQYYQSQRIPDEDRYEDRGGNDRSDESDYEHVRGQRSKVPQVQPRFYDPNRYPQGVMNTDRSEMSQAGQQPPLLDNPQNYGYNNYDNSQDYNNDGEEDDDVGHERFHQRRHLYNRHDNDEHMEAAHPSPPKYDYIEHNKGDYGKTPQKSYKRIHEINKEERDKLDTIFIQPRPKPKGGILKKRTGSQNSLNSDPQLSSRAPPIPGHGPLPPPSNNEQPYMPQNPEMTEDSEMSTAEQVWARRASTLASRLDAKGKKKGQPRLQKYNSDSSINQV